MKFSVNALALALLVPLWTATGAAAQDFSGSPIEIVVPFSTGGGVDTIARVIGPKLSEKLKTSVVVDNKPGASGMIGTQLVAEAAPDGHTLAIVSSSHASNPSLYKKLPYDTLKDFAPVTLIATSPGVLVVGNDVPAHSVKELIDLAKAKPGDLTYAHGGKGTSPFLAAELFKTIEGLDIVGVAYKGIGPAYPDLISGRVSMCFNTISSTTQYLEGGQLRALGVTGTKRSAIAPDIPTIAEAGVPGYDANSWYGVIAPAGTPPDVVKKLQTTISEIIAEPDVQKALSALGLELIGSTPEELGKTIEEQVAQWQKVMKTAGIEPE
jgi:tripartite-type tricarboxylate transporter receptor subunit TctC